MVVTSVVTYTFPIGPFLGAPSSRYGPSVDWGVTAYQVLNIILTILTWSVQVFKERFIDMQLLAPGESSL